MFTGPAKDENTEIQIEDVDKESYVEMLRKQIQFLELNYLNAKWYAISNLSC